MAKRRPRTEHAPSAGGNALWLKIDTPEVSLAQLKHVIGAWSDLLREVASELSGVAADAFKFVITDAKAGSFAVQVEPSAARKGAARRALPRISKAVTRGISDLQRQRSPRRPKYFSDAALERVKELAEESAVGHKPTVVIANGTGEPITLTARVADNVDELIGPKFDSIGTVEGLLEGLIIHGRQRFLIFEALTGREVKCYFDGERLRRDDVMAAFGHRVSATGTIMSRRTGEKVSINVRNLSVLPDDEQLPSPDHVLGILREA
jgi:hypothetical protein